MQVKSIAECSKGSILSLNAGQKYAPRGAFYHLMQVKSIAECSRGSILQYFDIH